MIPPRLLKQLADRLTTQTREGSFSWRKERADMQRYVHDLAGGQIVVFYNPSGGGPDSIELAVTDSRKRVIGSLAAMEDESGYDQLADLVFEIQREEGESDRAVTDEILRLLKS